MIICVTYPDSSEVVVLRPFSVLKCLIPLKTALYSEQVNMWSVEWILLTLWASLRLLEIDFDNIAIKLFYNDRTKVFIPIYMYLMTL